MKLVNKIVIGLFFFVLSSCQTEVYRHYYSDGTLKEEYSMRNGKFVGKYKALYENGKPQAVGQYERGLMSGVWQYYYPSGSIQSIQKYDEGKVVSLDYWDTNGRQVIKDGTGVVKHYYPSGQIESIMSYKNNVYHGKCETWFPNGIKASEVFYEEGKPTGTWLYWNEYGELMKTEIY
ncbi:toxin-antitoxin system YwqK family antitoxin [Bacteroides heparinolyticus]|uniref:toxin-antitoxin system YwqK family antitoxin n=1 Tax=Prevotella heparinolytica TaxID=28113 RepID=UPI0035A15FEB